MSVQLRLATTDDACAIAEIAALADLAAIDPNSPRVQKRLAVGQTTVATLNDAVIGFVDHFITPDPSGGRRIELDLLAVALAAQGRGVGGRLLAACVAAARGKGARKVRALVRCQNAAMRQLCHRHGFAKPPDAFDLYVVEPRPVATRGRMHDARVIVVETLAYAGIWLEGKLSQDALNDAHCLASQRELSLIGALVPSKALEAAELLKSNCFRRLSQYHWWVLNLENDRS